MNATDTDYEVLSKCPEGEWFTWEDLPAHVRRREYRLRRLHELGLLKRRTPPDAPHPLEATYARLSSGYTWQYRRRESGDSAGDAADKNAADAAAAEGEDEERRGDDLYNTTCERLWEKLEARRDKLEAVAIDLSEPFIFDLFAERHPEIKEWRDEVQEEFSYSMSERQCSWAVYMLAKGDMEEYNSKHGTTLQPRE